MRPKGGIINAFNFYGQQNQSFLFGNKVARMLLCLVFQTGVNNGEGYRPEIVIINKKIGQKYIQCVRTIWQNENNHRNLK